MHRALPAAALTILLAVPVVTLAQTTTQTPPGQNPGQVPTQVTPPKEAVKPQPHPVQPTLTVGAFYNDNVFWRATGRVSDLVLQVLPGIATTVVRSKVTFEGSYNLTAERYRDHPELTTAAARQTAVFGLTAKPSTLTTISASAGYYSTLNPAELNVSTGLTAGRTRAHRATGGLSFKQTMTARTQLEGGYEYSHTTLALAPNVDTQTGGLELAHDVGARTETSVKFAAQRYGFGAGGSAPVSTASVTLGMIRKLGAAAYVGIAAGPQWAGGRVRPEVDFSLGRVVRFTDVGVTYGRGQTTSVGLIGPIESDHVDGHVAYDNPDTARLLLGGGLYWSRKSGQTARVYHVAAEFGKPLSQVLSLVVGYTMDLQYGALGAVAVGTNRLERNTASIELSFTPWRLQ
jgi:hypothetical protein